MDANIKRLIEIDAQIERDMGMFDEIKCLYPLPFDWDKERLFQSKDTPAQFCDLYEIREDGTLWYETYDTEDRSDPTKEGLERIFGMATRVNKKWEQVMFTGEIVFYDFKEIPSEHQSDGGWVEVSTYFVDGKLNQLHVLQNREPVEKSVK